MPCIARVNARARSTCSSNVAKSSADGSCGEPVETALSSVANEYMPPATSRSMIGPRYTGLDLRRYSSASTADPYRSSTSSSRPSDVNADSKAPTDLGCSASASPISAAERRFPSSSWNNPRRCAIGRAM